MTPSPRPSRVAAVTVADVVASLPPGARAIAPSAANISLTGATQDSRAVRPGDLYIARPGSTVHGAAFCAAAAQAGAAAVLTDADGVERARAAGLAAIVVADVAAAAGDAARVVYGNAPQSLTLFGITGTNGKTTSAYLVEAGLHAAGLRPGLVGTVETRFAGQVVPSARTTPEAPDLHGLLAAMAEAGCGSAVMEVSSHALRLGRVNGLRYDVSIFTNLTQDHLDFHPTMEDYYAAKADLFTVQRSKQAVVNIDDPYGRRLAGEATCPVITFGVDPAADVQIRQVQTTAQGTSFALVGGGLDRTFSTRMVADFNVSNTAGALVAAHVAGLAVDAFADGVAAMPGVPGRLERVDSGRALLAVVDYAHTPDAVRSVLAALRPVTAGKLIIVLGCGGDRDAGKRPLMAAEAARGADLAVFTSDNPRSEDPQEILRQMLLGVPQASNVTVEPDRRAAIRAAVEAADDGDVVIVAGKGHERGQDIGGIVTPFDDVAELRAALTR